MVCIAIIHPSGKVVLEKIIFTFLYAFDTVPWLNFGQKRAKKTVVKQHLRFIQLLFIPSFKIH